MGTKWLHPKFDGKSYRKKSLSLKTEKDFKQTSYQDWILMSLA